MYDKRSDRVGKAFIALFEDFNPINAGLAGLTVSLDENAYTFKVEMFGRQFITEMCLLTKDSDVVGYVEYSEIFEGNRRLVDTFQINSQSYVTDVAGKELIPVQELHPAGDPPRQPHIYLSGFVTLPGVTAKSVITADCFCDSLVIPNQNPMTSLVIMNHAPMTFPTVSAAVVFVTTSSAQPVMMLTMMNSEPASIRTVRDGRTKSRG
jgi:hypothetical protein